MCRYQGFYFYFYFLNGPKEEPQLLEKCQAKKQDLSFVSGQGNGGPTGEPGHPSNQEGQIL